MTDPVLLVGLLKISPKIERKEAREELKTDHELQTHLKLAAFNIEARELSGFGRTQFWR